MKNTIAAVLAAGRGTRMKSDVPKVLHEILGRPMISYVLDTLKGVGITDTIVVAGYGSELLKKIVGRSAKVVIQKRLLGSGDALESAKKAIGTRKADLLVVCGDAPLITSKTLRDLIHRHRDSDATATILTARLKDPTGYGRILREDSGRILKIIEEEKASLYEGIINEVNSGTYCFKSKDIFEALSEVKPDNKKKEYFLTDAIEILNKDGKLIESLVNKDEEEIIGINTRADLAEARGILKKRILKDLMMSGVTVEDPLSTTIYPDVDIGRDTIIHPNTLIESDCEIGSRCHIGPFARIRGGTRIADDVEIGNFVELVRTVVKDDTKIKHHTYLGDTRVGRRVNIGAGTITANFDGKKKNRTIIEDGAFIGVGAILIAPVKIGKGAIIGAGCVVPKNHNVPDRATVVGVPARIIRKARKK